MPIVDTLLKQLYIDRPLDLEYVKDPSFESLRVIMDVGRASLHLRRYLRSRLEYYTVKLAFFEAANPQWVPGLHLYLACHGRACVISSEVDFNVPLDRCRDPIYLDVSGCLRARRHFCGSG
jgi:hypothetical protein